MWKAFENGNESIASLQRELETIFRVKPVVTETYCSEVARCFGKGRPIPEGINIGRIQTINLTVTIQGLLIKAKFSTFFISDLHIAYEK
jgi:hypothetical protein